MSKLASLDPREDERNQFGIFDWILDDVSLPFFFVESSDSKIAILFFHSQKIRSRLNEVEAQQSTKCLLIFSSSLFFEKKNIEEKS